MKPKETTDLEWLLKRIPDANENEQEWFCERLAIQVENNPKDKDFIRAFLGLKLIKER